MTHELSEEKISDHELKEVIREICKTSQSPSSVYRFQFNSQFTLKQATQLIPYLDSLGIDAIYASPIYQCTPGSPHGYNVTDPTKINSEIGTWDDFLEFSESLKKHQMKLILDVVPNHMGITGNNNPMWMDVLENGPSSKYAKFFDIDWNPIKPELRDKVLLPFLENHFGIVLENKQIQVSYYDGRFTIHYQNHQFPMSPKTYPLILENDLNALKNSIKENEKDYQEFLSIVTSFKNLPEIYENDPKSIEERSREKEIAKDRLSLLCQRSKPILDYTLKQVETLNGKKESHQSFDWLEKILNKQPYRLAYWQVAAEEINYRRFFDINELAAIRTEDIDVYNQYHQFIFDLIHKNLVHGLRIDHPDGLYDPPEYFRRLKRSFLLPKIYEKLGITDDAKKNIIESQVLKVIDDPEFYFSVPLYVVIEKILDRKESLPADWVVSGTVGYDYLNALNGLFIQKKNESHFSEIYEKYIGKNIDFDQLVYKKKKFFALIHMSSEINNLGQMLDRISELDRHSKDFTRNSLTLAIREVISCFPVYRTYIHPEDEFVSERDKKYIQIAIESAKLKTPAVNPILYDFLSDVLLLRFGPDTTKEQEKRIKNFILKFQQLTAPIMAKGYEDTAFYILNRFISLNEVGGDIDQFGKHPSEYHRQNLERSKKWPESFLTLTTHDTKRSQDVRMRINVLSEIPNEWEKMVQRWTQMTKELAQDPSSKSKLNPNLEYFIYQTLVGIWPDNHEAMDHTSFFKRIWQYILKAAREAKTDTNWIKPNQDFEKLLHSFLKSILSFNKNNPFLKSFIPFQKKISAYGKLNSLSALTLTLGSPGVIDQYQGNEAWNYTLVDPDNRRPIHYKPLQDLSYDLMNKKTLENLSLFDSDGRIKLYLLKKGLELRKSHPELFLKGEYHPISFSGKKQNNFVGYLRKYEDKFCIAIGSRFLTECSKKPEGVLLSKSWKETFIHIPKEIRGLKFYDVYSGKEYTFNHFQYSMEHFMNPLHCMLIIHHEEKI